MTLTRDEIIYEMEMEIETLQHSYRHPKTGKIDDPMVLKTLEALRTALDHFKRTYQPPRGP